MKLKKTTKLLFCQLPKGASSTSLRRPGGTKLSYRDLADVYEDSVGCPYLPYILYQLGMLTETTIIGENDKETPIYIVSRKNKSALNHNTINRVITETVGDADPAFIGELTTTVYGVQYVLFQKRQFEIDVVVVIGNDLESIKTDMEKNGIVVPDIKRRRRKASDI